MYSDSNAAHHRSCIIIGTGLSGLIQAAEIVRKGILPLREILILERHDDLGGVWREAAYPGAACDVKSHVYQVSWYPNYEWSMTYPERAEILAYYRGFAAKYGLPDVTLFNTKVDSAEWDESELRWVVKTQNTVTKASTIWTTDMLVLGTGVFNEAYIPTETPGFATYQGEMFHTSSWPKDVGLEGKSVVYIGSGATAVQAVPAIQPLVKDLTVVIRSVAFCLPKPNQRYSSWEKFIFRCIPLAAWLYSQFIACTMLVVAWAVRPSTVIAKQIEKAAIQHLDDKVKDPHLRKLLEPEGRFGTKRPLFSDHYYATLQKDNVHVVKGSIAEFTPRGVLVDQPGDSLNGRDNDLDTPQAAPPKTELKADIVILSTGFHMQRWGTAIKVIGREGTILSERLKEAPSWLYGMAIPQFPNLFLLQGPNTNMPWYPVPWTSEMQATFVGKMITELKALSKRQQRRVAAMATESAASAYTERIHSELKNFSTDGKYGKSRHFVDAGGRNTTFYPFMPWNYWWMLKKVNWSHFQVFRGAE